MRYLQQFKNCYIVIVITVLLFLKLLSLSTIDLSGKLRCMEAVFCLETGLEQLLKVPFCYDVNVIYINYSLYKSGKPDPNLAEKNPQFCNHKNNSVSTMPAITRTLHLLVYFSFFLPLYLPVLEVWSYIHILFKVDFVHLGKMLPSLSYLHHKEGLRTCISADATWILGRVLFGRFVVCYQIQVAKPRWTSRWQQRDPEKPTLLPSGVSLSQYSQLQQLKFNPQIFQHAGWGILGLGSPPILKVEIVKHCHRPDNSILF